MNKIEIKLYDRSKHIPDEVILYTNVKNNTILYHLGLDNNIGFHIQSHVDTESSLIFWGIYYNELDLPSVINGLNPGFLGYDRVRSILIDKLRSSKLEILNV